MGICWQVRWDMPENIYVTDRHDKWPIILGSYQPQPVIYRMWYFWSSCTASTSRQECCGCLLQDYLDHIGHLHYRSPVQATSYIEYHSKLTIRGKVAANHGVFSPAPSFVRVKRIIVNIVNNIPDSPSRIDNS